MSHHQQTALITPTSLIKDTHLFLCLSAPHDVCTLQTKAATHILESAHMLCFSTFYNYNTNWNKVGFNISQLFLFGMVVLSSWQLRTNSLHPECISQSVLTRAIFQ